MLEITVARTQADQVLQTIREVARVRSLCKEETDGDAEDITYCIYELPEDRQDAIETALNRFDDVLFFWC